MNVAPANFPLIATYSDAELNAYFQGFSTVMGNANPSPQLREHALAVTKEAIEVFKATN